jgi:hypothetical protein
MTKPAAPPAHHEVVEIDAMDVAEWESGQRTPQASDANLAELVRKTAAPPEPPARVQTVARERAGTQLGAPAIPRPPSRARTEPPGPPPKPARPKTAGGPPAAAARVSCVPDIPAAPAVEPRRSPAQTPVGGVDFSLPVTATSPGMPAAPESRRSPAQTPVGGVDFSLPVTATSESGTRPPEPEPAPLPPMTSPLAGQSRPGPARNASPFAEPSRVGPGHNASPASGAEPNTAWPPRPMPLEPSPQPPRLAAPDPAIQAPRRSGPDDAGDADRLKLAPSRRRLWWIGGGIASATLAAIVAAVMLPGPEALPPGASEAEGAQAMQAPGSRRDPQPGPVDRAAADLRERVRRARDAAAAGVPTAPAAADHRPGRLAADDPAPRTRSGEPEAVPMPRPGKRPHKVVVDYTARPNEPAPPSLVAQVEEDPAIGLARGAYTTGNQRLFVGDLAGAVRAYREALELYSGYVGGYRGLGLAYEQLGDTAHALVALRAYVAAVPNARDIALIRKRIDHLQRR